MKSTRKHHVRIIVPANTDQFNERILQAVQPVIPPDVRVDIRNLTTGNPCIENRYNLTENALPVVLLAKEAADEGVEGIFVTDFDMCGVEAAREVVDIPITGAFPPSAFSALMLSQRFSIITILGSTVAMQREHISRYGLEDGFASIRPINCPVNELSDLDKVTRLVHEQCLLAIREDGAQSFILGCTGFIGVAHKVSRMLEEDLGVYVPVIDPNQAAMSYLLLLVRNGIRQSRLCYSKATIGSQGRT